jgi:hypothetical protein
VEDLRDGKRGHRRVGLHQDRAVRAHGEGRAQLLLRIRRSDADGQHFVGQALFLDAQRLFQRDFIEGVDAHLDAIRDDARVVRFDTNADVVVHDAFDTDHDSAHALTPVQLGLCNATSYQSGRERRPARPVRKRPVR